MNFSKEKISPMQFMFLVILFTMGSAVLFLPSVLANAAEQDAWLSALIGTGGGGLLTFFYCKLHELFPEKGYFESVTFVFGKWFGNIILFITLVYFFILSTLLLWDIGNFLVTQIIVETPIEVIFILFTLTVIYGVRLGIENIARTTEIFIPWIFLLAIISMIFLLPELNKDHMFPILENGVKPVLYGSYAMLSFPYVELVAFLMIAPFVNQKEKVKKVFVIGVIVGGAMLIAATVFCVFILGAEITANYLFPVYILGKRISIGGFLERVEVIIAIVWFLSIYFKLAITYYFIVIGISTVFKLKDYRPITLPIGMLLVVLTPIMFTSSLYLLSFDVEVFRPLGFLVGLFFPLAVYIGGVIKKKKQKGNQGQEKNSTA